MSTGFKAGNTQVRYYKQRAKPRSVLASEFGAYETYWARPFRLHLAGSHTPFVVEGDNAHTGRLLCVCSSCEAYGCSGALSPFPGVWYSESEAMNLYVAAVLLDHLQAPT